MTIEEKLAKTSEVVAIVRCVDCKKTREIRPGEIDPDVGVPFCECGCVMVLDHAKAVRR